MPGTRFEFTVERRGVDPMLLVPLAAEPKPPRDLLRKVDGVCERAVSELAAVGALPQQVGQIAHTTRRRRYRRIVVVGLGEAVRANAGTLRQAGAAAARWLVEQRVERVTLWTDGLTRIAVEHPVAHFADGLVTGGFRFDVHKRPDPPPPGRIRIRLRGSERTGDRLPPPLSDALRIADAVNYARRLAHEPANVLHPQALADEARALARTGSLRCTVLGADALARRSMQGILSVGRGAEHKPCLIRLDYRAAPRSRPTVVIVGKAVTFDTGGYSLKDKQGLERLKFDKCGGAAVLGIAKAAADLRLPCNLTALVPAAENAISHEAYRPGDIIRMMSGKTVEIISTDAEGRLILADALCYAQQECRPSVMIDLATLTGGVVTALGKVVAGLMCNDENLAADLEACGTATHERLWRLPLWDDYRDLIKGNDSDIKNSSSKREAHPVVGGMFLKEFVGDVPWAHIDIAGVATDENDTAATGFGVRLGVEYLRRKI